MTQLQSVVESSKSELLSYFRGREYQPLTVGIVSPTMPSTASDKGIEKWLDFDMEDKESISDLMDALREPIKSSEKTANVSDKFETRKDAENVSNLQSYTNVENDDTWSQITSLPMEELQHTSAASEGKESKMRESSYKYEEEDTKGRGQSPLTFYPEPRSLTNQTPQTSQAVSVEKEDMAAKTAENFMVNATVNTPPPFTFYPQTLPLTSHTSKGEVPALSLRTSQQPPALASQTSKVQPRALSRQTSEEVIQTLSKQALQELLPIFKKQYLQRESTGLSSPISRRPTMKSQGIIQTKINFALLLLTF